MKERIDKLDFIETIMSALQNTMSRELEHRPDWEKTFAMPESTSPRKHQQRKKKGKSPKIVFY